MSQTDRGMTRITLPLTLRVRGPVITRSSSMGDPGVDAPMASSRFFNPATRRVENEDRFYIPGRLIKGLLRDAWEDFATVLGKYSNYIETWLGLASAPEEAGAPAADLPLRGRLHFGDFIDFESSASTHSLRYRIQIDEMRGAVENAMLQIIDSPYAPFQEIDFQGEIRWLAPAGVPSEIDDISEAILRGLSWIRAVGGIRTSGFGEVCGVQGKDIQVEPLSMGSAPASAARATSWNCLRLTFQEPLILAKRRISDNLFESDDILPGGALKGAIADTIARDPSSFRELARELHRVRFTHAFPAVTGGPRPYRIPLSVAEIPADPGNIGGLQDLIRDTEPPSCKRAIKFDIDWKDETRHKAESQVNWPKIPTELRVRTAVERGPGRAEEGSLFAWQMLVPYGHDWIACVETSALSRVACRQLEALLTFGIEPLGKTRSLARTELHDLSAPEIEEAEDYAVVLQSPALLLNPENLVLSSSGSQLREEYQRAWREISGDSLEMVNYFQRCSLTGGNYFQKRFRLRQPVYKPWLLCDAGSAFLLKPAPGKANEALARLRTWSLLGLPLGASVLSFYDIPEQEDLRWKHCPYVPENGYGEIAVNATPAFPRAG